jgi:hypothetical protein
MLFDPTKLPEEKWLSLYDVVHFCAFGEPYVNGICKAGYPSDRAYVAEINETAQRCLAEAGTAPKHSAFVELMNKPGLWQADAVAPLLLKCKPWPSSGQRLYDLFAQYDEAQADELKKLESATTQVEGCLMSGEVIFEGDRNGRRERIDPGGIYGPTIIWQNRTVSAHPREPQSGTRLFVWQEVLIERASLARWLDDMKATGYGQATPAQSAADETSTPPAQPRRKPGQRSKYYQIWENTLKTIALETYVEFGPYDRGAGALQTKHIDRIIERFKNEHPNEECPSISWFKPRLREIQPELDDYLAQKAAEGRD